MAVGVRWHLRLPMIALFKTQERQAVAEQTLSTAMRAALNIQEAALTRVTPVGVSGRARAAWTQRVTILPGAVLNLRGENVNPTPYALPLDQGQIPHWQPWGPGSDLALWAERKLGVRRLAFLVARAIFRGRTRGTAIRGVHMVDQAIKATRSDVMALFRRAQTLLARRWLRS